MRLHTFLDRQRTVAPPGFNRWHIPPAALAVHLCIGEIYGFSVFNVPLTRAVGVTHSITGQDWTIPEVGWIYSIALIMLGLSAAILGRWVERAGPRKTIFASAICFCGGLWLSSLGVWLHSIWLIYVGYGVIGGIGLGLGYIVPVSTLVKWFPDRPGMASGLAIMGFGGGALIGAPLGVELIGRLHSDTSVGVKEAFLVMGGLSCLHDVRRVQLPRARTRVAAGGLRSSPRRRSGLSPMRTCRWTSPGRRRSSGSCGWFCA